MFPGAQHRLQKELPILLGARYITRPARAVNPDWLLNDRPYMRCGAVREIKNGCPLMDKSESAVLPQRRGVIIKPKERL